MQIQKESAKTCNSIVKSLIQERKCKMQKEIVFVFNTKRRCKKFKNKKENTNVINTNTYTL